MTAESLAHAILDALERQGADYYAVEHLPTHQIGRLADLIATWCREVGIPIS